MISGKPTSSMSQAYKRFHVTSQHPCLPINGIAVSEVALPDGAASHENFKLLFCAAKMRTVMERWRDWMLAPLSLTQTVSVPGESRVECLDQADMLEEMGLNGEACEELITTLMLHLIIIFLATAVPSATRPSLQPSVVQLRPLHLTCSTPFGNNCRLFFPDTLT